MSKTRNKRPPDDNPVRRSMVDLTAAVKQAVEDGLLEQPAASVVALVEHSRLEHSSRADRATAAPERNDVAKPVPSRAIAAETPKKPATRKRDTTPSASAAEMMVQIAKDYQTSVLDNIKVTLDTALDQAKRLVEPEPRESSGDAPKNSGIKAVGAATAAFRAETMEWMQANLAMTLDYARELAGTRSAADFVELTAAQARKNFELVLKQAEAMKSLAQAVAHDGADREK